MKDIRFTKFMTAVLVLGGFFISACGLGSVEPTPTVNVELIQTEAVATFSMAQTETALAMPTDTPTATLTSTPTQTSTADSSPTASTPVIVVVPTKSCYSLAFVADVTVPDNTNMTPGQKFTKTWRVKNNGSCAWEVGFKFNFTGGEAMGASSTTLQTAVSVGSETELSVSLTAPTTKGTYRGNWRMTNASNAFFGDEVYVLIVVSGSTMTPTTPTATVTATPSATPTETPMETSES
jgi:hypothetical protein